ncbi:pescadillo-like [Juglans microcarpa x Juglans regia]|uniref:pescadillo-like n=1 Tax=Juglans microcarpa x Juglans regia TaxID=2249226 RepID=UPI001B7EFC9E|nr:pescadillo-like [Juglans microcarpa x Juglans regia]
MVLKLFNEVLPEGSTLPKDDEYMRHPADSLARQSFDDQYLEFGNEARNVRLELTTDGFNPFGNMSISYNTWPVVLLLYILPSWRDDVPPIHLDPSILNDHSVHEVSEEEEEEEESEEEVGEEDEEEDDNDEDVIEVDSKTSLENTSREEE